MFAERTGPKALEMLVSLHKRYILKVTQGQRGYLSIREFYLSAICVNKAPKDEGKGFWQIMR